jgi:LuxR family maltose regulon positive regulatory protein
MLQTSQRPPQEVLLTALINELTEHEGPLLIVMDDCHVIQSKPNHDALTFLVEHLPANFHLVVTSREHPPLPLHRLQARRQMLGVRQADLSFMLDEVIDLIRANSSFDLSLEQAELLARRSERRFHLDPRTRRTSSTSARRLSQAYLRWRGVHRDPTRARDLGCFHRSLQPF